MGSLFSHITLWKHAESLGAKPWEPLRKLWISGYVPSFDGTVWRLHAYKDARTRIVLTWNPTTNTLEQN